MGLKALKILASVIMLSVAFGCAAPSAVLSGKEKLEAKDWFNAGEMAYRNNDFDTAQYFYDLTVKKYPDSYYGRKAKENLGYVNHRRSRLGKAIKGTTEALEPVF